MAIKCMNSANCYGGHKKSEGQDNVYVFQYTNETKTDTQVT